jgi:hypothetical protein
MEIRQRSFSVRDDYRFRRFGRLAGVVPSLRASPSRHWASRV